MTIMQITHLNYVLSYITHFARGNISHTYPSHLQWEHSMQSLSVLV
jgi:hypothetical protein